MRNASPDKKIQYLHKLVSVALKDFLPHFKDFEISGRQLDDFPLAAGRRIEKQLDPKAPTNNTVLEHQCDIHSDLAEATATQFQHTVDQQHMI